MIPPLLRAFFIFWKTSWSCSSGICRMEAQAQIPSYAPDSSSSQNNICLTVRPVVSEAALHMFRHPSVAVT